MMAKPVGLLGRAGPHRGANQIARRLGLRHDPPVGVAKVLKRTAGSASLAGAGAFFGFWLLTVFDALDDIPWVLSGAWHGLTIALLAIGFIGSQIRRGDRRAPWLAWTGVVLVLIGLVTVVQALIAGFFVFGRGPHGRRPPRAVARRPPDARRRHVLGHPLDQRPVLG